MFAAGMTARLAEAVAGVAGSAYLLVLPLIGGLGGFLTASNAGSNAMFAQFQTAVGAQPGLPEPVIAEIGRASLWGKSVAVRVYLGGRRLIEKKKKRNKK